MVCLELNLNMFLGGLAHGLYVLDALHVESFGYLLSPTLNSTEPAIVAKMSLANSHLAVSYSNETQLYSSGSQLSS